MRTRHTHIYIYIYIVSALFQRHMNDAGANTRISSSKPQSKLIGGTSRNSRTEEDDVVPRPRIAFSALESGTIDQNEQNN